MSQSNIGVEGRVPECQTKYLISWEVFTNDLCTDSPSHTAIYCRTTSLSLSRVYPPTGSTDRQHQETGVSMIFRRKVSQDPDKKGVIFVYLDKSLLYNSHYGCMCCQFSLSTRFTPTPNGLGRYSRRETGRDGFRWTLFRNPVLFIFNV